MLAYTHITQTIAALLYKHDCVIVPEFGGYVARQQGSFFSTSGTVLHPPAKTILFNRNLVHSDGLLVSAVMAAEGISYEEASALLTNYVAYCKAMLQARNRLELKNLGLFYIDAEQTLRFEPEVDVNFLLNSFGLEPLLVHELTEERALTQAPVLFEDRKSAPDRRVIKPKRHYTRIAALAVGVPAVLAMMLFVATSRPMKPLMESSLNPFYTPEKTYSPAQYRSLPALQAESRTPLLADANGYATFTLGSPDHVLVANINDTVVKADKTMVKRVKAAPVSSGAFDGAYQVVVGCFGVKDNAQRLVHELHNKNISAGISGINNKGLHIVSCGGFSSKAEAANMLNTVRGAYPNAWIMAK